MKDNVLEKYSPKMIMAVGLIICSLAVICYDCLFIYRQVSTSYYSENVVLGLSVGTYKSSDGHNISVDSEGNILYDGSYSLILSNSDNGNIVKGNVGQNNILISLYQISNTMLTTISSYTYTDSSGVSVTLNAYTSFVLENSSLNVDENGIYEVWNENSKVNSYSDLQSAVDAAGDNSIVKITKNFTANSGVYINKNITIDGCNNTMDKANWHNAVFIVEEGISVNINNLIIDGGALGFAVDYDAVTYTNSTIPLVTDSATNDVVQNFSAIVSKGNLNINNVEVNNNYTTLSGAAIYIVSGTLNINDSSFDHNRAKNGDSIYIGSSFKTEDVDYPVSNVVIKNSFFSDSYATNGGAIYLYNLKEFTIQDSSFENNTVNGSNGGAINIYKQSSNAVKLGLDFVQGVIDSCNFINNWAGNDGFAISNSDAEVKLTNSIFKDNVGVHPSSSVATYSMNISRDE